MELRNNNFYGRPRSSQWSYGDYQQDHEYLLGFSWPTRSYSCSFCKREFRSAQALGGHMNVHRRDRARLRLQQSSSSSSTLSPPSYPNCNYTYSSMAISPPPPLPPPPPPSPPPPPPPPRLTLFPTLSPPSSTVYSSCLPGSLSLKSKYLPENACETMKPSLVVEAEEAKRFCKKDPCKFLKNGEIISLELEIGLINESEQDLDLELRLGFA